MKEIRVGLIGHRFIGTAHTHAVTDVSLFFDLGVKIIKKKICANEQDIFAIAERWGWESATLDWKEVVSDPQIDAVIVGAPSAIHKQVVLEAIKAGKHVFCEKPLALTLEDAREMKEAAERAGIVHMIGFNYRRVPALAYAKRLIEQGYFGQIFHFRGIYQQDWLTDPNFPLVWRVQSKLAGYGSHGDLGAHVVDLAYYLVGDIERVNCVQQTFVEQRPVPKASNGLKAEAGEEVGQVDVDDASSMLVQFKESKTVGYIEVTRYGNGHRNQNRIEINGSKASMIFDMEKMNELQLYQSDDTEGLQGFKRVQIGEDAHPYMSNWWPAGHIIGFGDTFVNQACDFFTAIKENKKVNPDFTDGYNVQVFLDAAQRSAETGAWVNIEEELQ